MLTAKIGILTVEITNACTYIHTDILIHTFIDIHMTVCFNVIKQKQMTNTEKHLLVIQFFFLTQILIINFLDHLLYNFYIICKCLLSTY